jgi:hypothetical protein
VLVNTSEETTMEPIETQIIPPESHFSWQDDNPAFGGDDDDDFYCLPDPWLLDHYYCMPEFDYNNTDMLSELTRWLTQYDELIGLPAGIFEEIMGRSGDANK